MTLGGTPAGRRLFCALALACAFAFTLQTTVRRASAQKSSRTQRAAPSPTPSTAANAPNDNYAAKIREYTTEKYFLTELVDHLPASDTVPSPDKVLGYVVGTPNKLTYTKDIHRYFRELDAGEPARQRLRGAGEERGGARADSGRRRRRGEPGEARSLQRDHRAARRPARTHRTPKRSAHRRGQGRSTGLSGSIHSPETGSPEMLMEMAYRLAVEESPFIQDIRKNIDRA